ncbi:hypothetical protein MTR_4g007850 [Medicago truncatula]|uniref:Homologous-pairing protein 2 winged helix domain-containing protein n=1 Tax=Medicago truncatula TaxID=3880 RepID=A0A072UGL3_MEDTR|nr:hypothetical protein MTR_4g007850 [Medicago truncatula]
MAPFLRFFVSPFHPPKPKSDNAEAIEMNFVKEQNRPLNALQKFNPKKTVIQKALDTLQNEELNQMKKKNPDLQKQLEDICEFEAANEAQPKREDHGFFSKSRELKIDLHSGPNLRRSWSISSASFQVKDPTRSPSSDPYHQIADRASDQQLKEISTIDLEEERLVISLLRQKLHSQELKMLEMDDHISWLQMQLSILRGVVEDRDQLEEKWMQSQEEIKLLISKIKQLQEHIDMLEVDLDFKDGQMSILQDEIQFYNGFAGLFCPPGIPFLILLKGLFCPPGIPFLILLKVALLLSALVCDFASLCCCSSHFSFLILHPPDSSPYLSLFRAIVQKPITFETAVNRAKASPDPDFVKANSGSRGTLWYGHVSIQELALKVAFRLSGTSEEAKKAMGDAGFMEEFVKFLNAKSFEVREMAAEALSGIVTVPRNRKRFVQDDHNIALLLQLLDPEEGNSGNKKFLISILMSLTSCNSARKKIVSSGYAKNIDKLAEAEISCDPKKPVKKLSTNKFRSMLNGIRHS